MTIRKMAALVCAINLLSSTAQAVTIPQTYLDQVTTSLTADSIVLSQWMTSQLKYAVPFNSTAGNVVPSQLKILGIEVGVEGIVSGTKVDVNGFHALPTTLVDTQSVDMFSRLPIPLVLAHAKIGLPFGLDAGVRMGGIPEKSIKKDNSEFKIKNKVFGLDVRKKIIDEGALKPFGLTVGLNYTHADGSMDYNNTNISGLSYSSGGHTVSLANGSIMDHASWKTNSVGLQAVVDKKIFIITPYLGASVNRNSGSISNSITSSGNAALDGVTDTATALSAVGASTEKPNKWDVRGLAGFELSILPFVKLGFQGEYSGSRNVAGALGLRIQFR